MTTGSASGIVFWVVVRDKATRKILRTKPFTTHEEAVHYNPATEDPVRAAGNEEVSIEILAAGREPK